MMLVSIRLPVMLVEQLDRLANSRGVRRADVIREAISVFMANEPERALDLLRRAAHERPDTA
jgi:predicted DNA-binding protein